MQKTAINIGILAALLFSAASFANSYDRGIKMYRRADFKGAERAFLDVLRGGANRATKGRVYKYIGLCQFMLGRKSEARASFHSALKYNPKTEIFPNEALDSSVLEFFLEIKQDSKQGIGVPAAPPPSIGKKSYPSPRKPTVSKQQAASKASKKVSKKAPPRRAKAMPRKPAAKRANTVRATKAGRQAVKKKTKKDSMFTNKGKKPPRVIFKDNSTKERSQHSQKLFLPTSEDNYQGFQEASDLWRFFPFGVGQYVNDSYKLGHAFAAAGILTLGSFVFHIYRLQVDQIELDELYEGRAVAFNNLDKFIPAPTNPDPCNHTLENFKYCWDSSVADWEDYIGALKLYSYLSLAAFAAVWAGGVAEAMLNRPTLQKYSLMLPQMHYGYNGHNHQFALLWQYQLP